MFQSLLKATNAQYLKLNEMCRDTKFKRPNIFKNCIFKLLNLSFKTTVGIARAMSERKENLDNDDTKNTINFKELCTQILFSFCTSLLSMLSSSSIKVALEQGTQAFRARISVIGLPDAADYTDALTDINISLEKPVANLKVNAIFLISTRSHTVSWMQDIFFSREWKLRTVENNQSVSSLFCSTTSASFRRAERLRDERDKCAERDGGERLLTITRVIATGLHTVRIKSRPGSGRNMEYLIKPLHADLKNEFDCLRKLGVKINLTTLQVLFMDTLHDSVSNA